LAQLDSLPKPEGVDAKLWDELKAALHSALTTNSQQLTTKNVSTPPTGDANHVADFGITDHGDGSYSLSWHYRNLGDYDQNGTVGVSDITPLAIHYGETYVIALEQNTIQAVVDGSGNEKVGIEDVTQIAMYFGTTCVGYSLRASDILPTFVSDTAALDVISLSFAQGEGRYEFGVDHALPSHSYIAVAPVDSEGAFGVMSNIVQTQNHNPVAALTVDPAEGDAPLTVGLDAGESSDIDGPIAKFEWDFEGDGVWDEDSGTLSYVEHLYEAPDFYYPVVRVTDANGAKATAEGAVFAGRWRITTVFDSLTWSEQMIGFEVVDGNPAIGFFCRDETFTSDCFSFARAQDPLGTAWGGPVAICAGGIGNYVFTSLATVDGFPAVAFVNDNGSPVGLVYARAIDSIGSAWGTLQTLDGQASRGDMSFNISMAMINNRPAVAYVRGLKVWYIRSQDTTGASWLSPMQVSPSYGRSLELKDVNGAPAISYSSQSGIEYIRASDADGDIWGEPVLIDNPDVWLDSSLEVVNGNPALSYRGGDGTQLKYIRANDPIGSSWGAPITVIQEGQIIGHTSLAMISSRPAISYEGGNPSHLKYIHSKDANGNSWRPPLAVDANAQNLYSLSLKEIAGHPAIAYLAGLSLDVKYAVFY
jgi:PKD repeat protein